MFFVNLYATEIFIVYCGKFFSKWSLPLNSACVCVCVWYRKAVILMVILEEGIFANRGIYLLSFCKDFYRLDAGDFEKCLCCRNMQRTTSSYPTLTLQSIQQLFGVPYPESISLYLASAFAPPSYCINVCDFKQQVSVSDLFVQM